MAQVPLAVGLLVCEQVIVEEHTRNVTIVNSFTRKFVSRFPSTPFPFVVFAVLTDGLGEMQMELKIQHLEDWDVVYRRRFTYQFVEPLQPTRFQVRVTDCSFPEPGVYQVGLYAAGEMIAQRTIAIRLQEEAS